MGKTDIEWTDVTWNPIRGCSRVSAGCTRCYAEQQAARIVRMGKGAPTPYDGLVRLVGGEPRWTGEVRLVPEQLAAPLGWRKPRRVFVNSMSDLFHERLSNEQIAAVFGVMAAAPRHTFQVLTKRARRMREWFEWANPSGKGLLDRVGNGGMPPPPRKLIEDAAIGALNGIVEAIPTWRDNMWPLLNVWLGVSVEDQAAADERIPELLRTPAAVRFLSCEPLLGPVDLTHRAASRALVGEAARRIFRENGGRDEAAIPRHLQPPPSIDWIIAGCESGPGARPADVAWFRSLRDQCASAGVAYFLKQATETRTRPNSLEPVDIRDLADGPDRPFSVGPITVGPGSHRKPGHVIGAPYLDGVQHLAFPEVPGGR